MGKTVCSIGSLSYSSKAAALFYSVRQAMGGVNLVYLCINDSLPEFSESLQVEVLKIEQMGLSDTERRGLQERYNIVELSTALKPYLLRHLIERDHGEVIYLDPDILVLGSLENQFQLSKNYDCVITPHRLTPITRSTNLKESIFLRYGTFNLGFIAVSSNSIPLLKWWWERTFISASMNRFEDEFTDQKWANLFPAYFNCLILKDPGSNVAIWNIDERKLRLDSSGRLLSNGVPLSFIHFSQQSDNFTNSQNRNDWIRAAGDDDSFRLIEISALTYRRYTESSSVESMGELEDSIQLNSLHKRICRKVKSALSRSVAIQGFIKGLGEDFAKIQKRISRALDALRFR